MDAINNGRYNFFLKAPTDRAVLLIHGITGTPSEMRYFGKSINKSGINVFCNTLPRHCSTLSDLKKVTWQEIADACRKDFLWLKEQYAHVSVAGLSMGALMAIHLAFQFPNQVKGIVALAPTVFYDGWAVHKGKALMEIFWHIPLVRNLVDIRESPPYGLKDEGLRENVERFYRNARASSFSKKVFLFGSPFFPVACLYQHHLFAKTLEKEYAAVTTPILIMHAREDDMTSLKNSEYIYARIASPDKRLFVLEDSFHMLTIDKEKYKVAEEAARFIHRL